MTMHLEGPWLTKVGKKKGKQKFRSAAQAQRSRELTESWKDLKKKWGIEQEERKRKRALESSIWVDQSKVYRRDTPKLPSLNGGIDMSPAYLKPNPIYTGDKIKGIGTMHKSNAVPVFTDEEAVNIASMRR